MTDFNTPRVAPFLAGGGEMGALIRAHDWGATSLGHPEGWPQGLKTAIRLLLSAGHPMYIWWGPDLLCFYNDAYRASIGAERHPGSLGQPGRQVWAEIWPIIGPQIERVLSGRGSTWHENQLVPITRDGRLDEVYWTYSYNPIHDETAANGIGGVLVICAETTEQVLAERRLAEAAERQRRMFDQAPGFVIIMRGPDHVVDFVNETHRRDFSSAGWLGRPLREAVPELEDQGLLEWLGEVYRTGRPYHGHATPVRRRFAPDRSEETRYLDFVCAPWLDADGRVQGVFCVGSDVSEAKRAGDAKQAIEARYRALVEASASTVWTTAADGSVTEDSPSWRAYTGQSAEERLGWGWLAAVHPDERAFAEHHWREAVMTGRPVDTELRLFHAASETWRLTRVRAAPLRTATGAIDSWIGMNIDIESRRRTEVALAESEARFRNLADHAPVMMWVTDPTGRCTYLNRRWYEFTGQKPAEAEAFGWLDAVHPDDRGWSGDTFLAANAKREPFRLEYRLRRADGTYRWAIDAASPRFGPDGEFLGYVGSVFDIDERREAEARLQALANAVPAIVWFASPDGRVHYLNERWYEYTGQTEAEALPDGWAATLHPQDAERTAAAWAPARAEETTYEVEMRYRRRDGLYRWYVARAEPLRDASGAVTTWFGTSTDIHDRKLSEYALRELAESLERRVAERTAELAESQRRFRGIFDSALQFMALLAPDGTVLEVNQTALDWSEITPADIVGKPFWLAAPMRDNPALQAAIKTGIERAAAGMTVRAEHEMRGAGEVRAVVDFSLKPVQGADGVPVWLVAEGRDITELKQAQDALRQAQKLEAVGQLTGGVAHDFNNLLTIVRSSADLLRKPSLPEEKRRRYVDAISDTVDRASKLTSQLLAFARRQSLKPELFEAAERIRAIKEMLGTIAGGRIEIVTEFPCEGCFVEADASQFETALVNIVVNARDAMNGEGRLTIRVDQRPGLPGARGPTGDGAFVAVAIRDTGVGIPSERLPHIFEPFFTTKEVGKGTGLGLSQVYGFVKQSGGDITVESSVGRGTTFTLLLPRVEEPATQEAGPTVRNGVRLTDGHGRAVLIVEDNVEIGAFSSHLLRDLGYQATWAENADAALRLLEGGARFDVVFSDVVMPGMSGVELGQEIRRRFPGLPVVLTSGYSHVLAEQGRHGFELLHKPYAAEQLSRILRRVTGRRSEPGG